MRFLSGLSLAVLVVGCTPGRHGTGSKDMRDPNDTGLGFPGCVGLQCQQASNCAASSPTVLTGKVHSPKADLPLYNALVYVPNAPLEPFANGVSCEKCGGAGISGSPVVKTLTDSTGSFTLANVPVGADIPLVIQIGRWRRQVVVPHVERCTTTPLTSVDLTRLPRNKLEGDIPHIAIATGGADPFECLLRKIGIDDAEITRPSDAGRVHFYHENGYNLNPPTQEAVTLYSNLSNLMTYDVVMLPCEGFEDVKSNAIMQ